MKCFSVISPFGAGRDIGPREKPPAEEERLSRASTTVRMSATSGMDSSELMLPGKWYLAESCAGLMSEAGTAAGWANADFLANIAGVEGDVKLFTAGQVRKHD